MKKRDLVLDFTSLLDVLMILLFIIMSNTSRLSAESIEEAEQLKGELDAAEKQIQELDAELKMKDDISESYAVYESQAVIITLDNILENDTHVLRIATGEDMDDITSIRLDIDSVANTQSRIRTYVENVLSNTDNQPVYMVFHLDSSKIYKAEYDAIIEELERLQRSSKEAFYKVTEGEYE